MSFAANPENIWNMHILDSFISIYKLSIFRIQKKFVWNNDDATLLFIFKGG